MNMPRRLVEALAILILLSAAAGASGDSQAAYENTVKPFLQTHCLKCHGEQKTLAGLRLDTLGTDFLGGKTADVWREIYDRIGNRTMPPKKEARPDAAEALKVADWIILSCAPPRSGPRGMSGRIPTRRLNRTEYTNTLRDLLSLDENFARALEQDLPMDGKVDGFDRGGAGLFIDGAQMVRYLETGRRRAVEGVFAAKPKWTASGRSVFREKIRWTEPKYNFRYIDLPARPLGHALQNKERIAIPSEQTGKLTRGGLEFVGAGYHGDGGIDMHAASWHLAALLGER